MHISKRIHDRSGQLKHYINSNLATQSYRIMMSIGNRSIALHFDQIDGEIISNLGFSGDLGSPWEAIYDLYLDLIEGASLSEVQKVDMRQLDYYLRDNPSVQIFDYYPDEFLHIFHTYKLLNKAIEQTHSKDHFFDKIKYGEFLELPASMQFDLLEDFLAENLDGNCQFENLEDEYLFLRVKKEVNQQQLQDDLNFHFQTNFILKLTTY